MSNAPIQVLCQRYVTKNGAKEFPYFLGALDPKVLDSVAVAPSFEDDTKHFKLAADVLSPPAEHWQRPVIQKKVEAIASNFDKSGEIMPNPVLLAVIPKKTIKVEKQVLINGAETGLWLVQIPPISEQKKSLWIIDGQHRVKGLSKTKTSQSLDSPCLAVILGLYFSAMKHKCGTAASLPVCHVTSTCFMKELERLGL